MKKSSVVLTTFVLGVASLAFAQAQTPVKPPQAPPPAQAQPPVRPAPSLVIPTKIGIINMGQAIQSTKEGQKAAAEMNNKYGPRQAEYAKRQQEIDALTDQANKGRATMSDDALKKMAADITVKTTNLKRFQEDTTNEMETDDQKIGAELQGKMYTLVQQYGIQNGYAVVLDIGSQQSPVIWAAAATNITEDMVKLYDQYHPVREEAAPPKPPAAPPTTPPSKKKP